MNFVKLVLQIFVLTGVVVGGATGFLHLVEMGKKEEKNNMTHGVHMS